MLTTLMQTTNPLAAVGIGGILLLGVVIFVLFRFLFRGN
jgi:hypothetical protein